MNRKPQKVHRQARVMINVKVRIHTFMFEDQLYTACIEGFFDVKKGIENAMKSTNFMSKFCTLKNVIKLKLFLLCHSLFLEKFEFNYTFQGAKFANEFCTFHSIFYTLFYIKKSFYAGCVRFQAPSTSTNRGSHKLASVASRCRLTNSGPEEKILLMLSPSTFSGSHRGWPSS
jgi:hypothetical protein